MGEKQIVFLLIQILFIRFSPCMEWDTAAGQIICKEAGFDVIDQITNLEISYNRENLLNNSFIVKK